MACFVFISKDDDEYNRYRNGNPDFWQSYGRIFGKDVYYLVAPLKRGGMVADQSSDSCFDYVVVINSKTCGGAKQRLADENRVEIDISDKRENESVWAKTNQFLRYVNAVMQYADFDERYRASMADWLNNRDNLVRKVNDASKKNMVKIKDLTVFVHWGFGELPDILKAEKEFQSAIDKWSVSSEDAADDAFYNFPGLKVFSLSSRRQNMFDVTGTRIHVPVALEELNALVAKFKNVQVNEALSHCAAKHNWKISPETRTDIVELLDKFASRVLNSSLSTKKKRELLQAVAMAKNETFDNAQNTSVETAELMAKILNKEVFND